MAKLNSYKYSHIDYEVVPAHIWGVFYIMNRCSKRVVATINGTASDTLTSLRLEFLK